MPGSCLHPLVLSLFMQALLVFLLFLKHPRAHPTVSGHLHLPISVPGKLSLPGCAQALLSPFSSPPRYQLLRAFLDSPPPAASCLYNCLSSWTLIPTGEGWMLTPWRLCLAGAEWVLSQWLLSEQRDWGEGRGKPEQGCEGLGRIWAQQDEWSQARKGSES